MKAENTNLILTTSSSHLMHAQCDILAGHNMFHFYSQAL